MLLKSDNGTCWKETGLREELIGGSSELRKQLEKPRAGFDSVFLKIVRSNNLASSSFQAFPISYHTILCTCSDNERNPVFNCLGEWIVSEIPIVWLGNKWYYMAMMAVRGSGKR